MSQTRFRVKRGGEFWASAGPDLLRTEDNARRKFRGALGDKMDGWYSRRKDGTQKSPWDGPLTREQLVEQYDRWAQARDTFQVGRKTKRSIEVFVEVLAVEFEVPEIAHCTAATNLVSALIETQFPDVIHSGGFYYRQISGSTAWSDHAWGTALDKTHAPEKGVTNDEVFDWLARMAQTGNMDYDYALGSQDGWVMSCSAPDFKPERSGAASSHLWHNHISVVDHDGAKPPRNPMVP